MHTCESSSWETEAEESLVQGQLGYNSEIVSQKQNKERYGEGLALHFKMAEAGNSLKKRILWKARQEAVIYPRSCKHLEFIHPGEGRMANKNRF
jgi:hypothetical protein